MLQKGLRRLLGHRIVALVGQLQLPVWAWMPAQPITVSSSLRCYQKDPYIPNVSWRPDMMDLYNEFLEKTKDGSWTQIPKFLHSIDFLTEKELAYLAKAVPVQVMEGARFFLRINEERLGFQHAIFHNKLEKKSVCLFQPGPLLEGFPGITHGGALAAMIDNTFFMTAYKSANAFFTGTMTISFISAVALCSGVRLDTTVTGMEGRKVFLSCTARSSDGSILFAEASATFFQMK